MKLVKVMDVNQVIIQIDALIVVEMGEYDQIKVFLQYSKLVLNVQDLERKLLTLVAHAMGKEKGKLQKDYRSQFLKVLMMGLE